MDPIKSPNVHCNPSEWVNQYADELYTHAFYKTRKQELAEDLVQETFLSALSGLDSFMGNSSEKTWLFSILKNKIIDHFRKASTRYEEYGINQQEDEYSSSMEFFFNDDGEWSKNTAPKEWSVDYSLSIEGGEFEKVFESCMGKLSPIGSAVISLKFIEERKGEEICKELSISSSNYWTIMHRAKLQLRACMEKNWFKS